MRRVLIITSLRRGFLMLVIALTAWVQIASPAWGRGADCLDHTSAVTRLMLKYGEQLVAQGLATDGMVVELYASANGDTWSILVVSPTGVACLAAAGEGWTLENVQIPGRDA